MLPKFDTIDAYLTTLTKDRRTALARLRKSIRSVIPKAEECFSYGMPAFRLNGVVVAGFVATSKGCSYFPFSGRTLTTLADDVRGYQQTKGSLHFDPAKALPVALVRKLIRTRIAEARRKTAVKARRRP
jgi:uncharacterized protein YdhG (YjbR/CyaY superfamily)